MSAARYIAIVVVIVASAGCRRDMFNQPSAKPLARSDAFQNNQMASRPVVPNSVARGQLEDDSEFYTGKIGTNLVTTLPSPVTRELLERGQERYNIHCSPCHDRTGDGNGMIVQRGFPRPPSFHVDRLRQAPIGHFYDVITHGYGIMYSYAARVEAADRWAIAAYIRVLQTSQNGQVADVPEEDRTKLQAKK
jgi:mono/diheme cytochrome c family protein